jgi:hypothetical protein
VYPDERVARLITENFIPARLHVKDQAADFQRFGERYNAQWTPTVLFLDSEGVERHRIEGFLPNDDFLGQLMLGLGQLAFKRGDFTTAGHWFRKVVDTLPNSDAAPEAQYWAGVSEYKGTGNGAALGATARAFSERYQDTTWAKKASIWK